LFGPDLLVAPVVDENTRRPVYLPVGDWVDYWTGAAVKGGQKVVVDVPVDKIAVWVKAGAVIPKIPDDVMTLVPQSESGNTRVKSLDNRRVYEINDDGGGASTMTDFEGRSVVRNAKSLKIRGNSAAHVIVRWRFAKPKDVTVNGAAAKVVEDSAGDWVGVEFDHTKESVVEWK
jgi:alpha-D-xyloside xylohydrolase